MYKRKLNQVSLFENPAMFGGIALDPKNEWVKLAGIIPWWVFEKKYAEQFPSGTGQPACSLRMALGSQIIKERYRFSDEMTVEHIAMNPYLQYFIGLTEYRQTAPFDPSMMSRFRQRLTPEMMQDEKLDKTPKAGGGKREMGVRNFIINNVIESQRFRYLARYANISNVSQLAKSAPLVRYVLKEIPDAQILRYYNAVCGENYPYDPAMREELARRLADFSFEDLRDVRNNDREMNRQEQEEKRRKQALVRLYLTVLYLAVKNLVYVNSRYFMAYHCVERDRILYAPEKWERFESRLAHTEPENYGFAAFAREYLDEHPPKPRVRGYLNTNFANSDNWAINAFRNKVEHLDAVRSAASYIGDVRQFQSWYELYHYILQRSIIDQYSYDSQRSSKFKPGEPIISEKKLNPRVLEYGRMVMKYGGYCRDAVKALCVPFAYNLPRYKNLTMEGLFDKNRPGKKDSGRIESRGQE